MAMPLARAGVAGAEATWTRASSLDRAQLALMGALGATVAVSIFATQLLLSLALVVLAARLLAGRTRLARTPLDAPILAFCVWTLLSASFSSDPQLSFHHAKKLLLFALLYLAIEALAREADRERILNAVLVGGIALAGLTVLQSVFLGFDSLQQRPHGFLGHYMSSSGLSMGVAVVACARLAFAREPPKLAAADARFVAGLLASLVVLAATQAAGLWGKLPTRIYVLALASTAGAMALSRGAWPSRATGPMLAAVALPLSAWALVLSQTRNAWVGALAGLAVVAVLRAPRALWLLAAVVLALLVSRPAAVASRLTLEDESSRDRYYQWQAGVDMLIDRPVFGHGPGTILTTYPHYRWPDAPNPLTPHLHNNALQLAAERGLPCVVFWLWWVAAAMGDAWRETRAAFPRDARWAAAAALGVLAAMLVAGMFEYNFGDSEVLMFALLLSALPYALRRQRAFASGAAA